MDKKGKIKNLTVFCGSRTGTKPVYAEHAALLGTLLAKNDITLIYGGGNKGLMGVLANAALKAGGKVIGIMPEILAVPEHAHKALTELVKVKDIHTRKKLLYKMCDAALVLAGGFGSMDELFEILTWNQLHIHNKKIFIVNSAGFYDNLISQLKMMEAERFLYQPISKHINIVSSPSEIEF